MAQNLAQINAEYERVLALLPGELNDDDLASLVRCCRAKGTVSLSKYDSRRRRSELHKPSEMRMRSDAFNGGAYTAEKQTNHFGRPAQHDKDEYNEMYIPPKCLDLTAVDPKAGFMIALELDKKSDITTGPSRLQASDLLFQQYRSIAQEWNEKLNRLEFVWHFSITNVVTGRVIKHLLVPKQRGSGKTFKKGSDELAVLLRTPNGKTVLYMLHDYCSTLD
ncbi:hypothetical protein AC578_11151 [Pseudocercospora eumusae]|uniref:Uncharacterized protein n=1 Tax=Pseudocercospora eumusae TaxID=321146 RepID=A0A139GYD8_9PEZI|nr:hypothetical protein AC578_11151 [Pseudocercospora eumusae]